MHKLTPLILLTLTAATLAQTAPATQPVAKIPLEKSTTYFTAPLHPDGTVDYVAALDNLAAKDATKDNNAFIPLLQATGTGSNILSKSLHDPLLAKLHLADQPGLYVPRQTAGPAKEIELLDTDLRTFAAAPWKPADHPDLASWLHSNQSALELAVLASKRDHIYIPLISADHTALGIEFPAFATTRYLTSALIIRSMQKLQQGDTPASRADLLAAHRLCRLLTQTHNTLHAVLASLIEDAAWRAEASLASSGKLTAAEIKDHRAALAALPPAQSVADAIDLIDRTALLDTATLINTGGLPAFLRAAAHLGNPELTTLEQAQTNFITDEQLQSVDFPEVLRAINAHYDQISAAMRQPDAAKRQAALADLDNLPAGDIFDRLKPDRRTRYVARTLLKVFTPPLARIRLLESLRDCRGTLVTVSFALAAYHADHNDYPPTLAPLEKTYLPKLPPDPFTNAPLHFIRTPTGYLLYSVGPDFQDDHGIETKPLDKGDIVIKVGE